jgi:D-alanine-D-alanine ligase-like ATP-grasp enzyme
VSRPPAHSALELVTRPIALAGLPGRRAAHAVDLLAAAGPRYAWQRGRERAAIARLGSESEDTVFGEIWSGAAAAAGAELESLGDGFYGFRRGGAATRVWRHVTPLDDAVAMRWALDKPRARRLVSERGVPVPEWIELDCGEAGRAAEFVRAGAQPCVVKPAGQSSGSGVTAGIREAGELRRALVRAARFGRRVVLERQVAGHVHRLLFLEGELLDIIRRHPPVLTGDGRSTIRQLVAAENGRRMAAHGRAGLTFLFLDLEAVLTLERTGLRPGSVPAAGERVALKTVTSQNSAEENETVLAGASHELVAEAAAAVAAVGLRIGGVDIVTGDSSRSLTESGGAVIEVNATPGLHYHYLVADPDRATPVAAPVLERLLG